MNPNAPKNLALMEQYPFIPSILTIWLEPKSVDNGLNDLTIKVERADGDLLYRQADNTGIGDKSFLIGEKERDEQVGKVGDYLFAIDHANAILKQVKWPRSRDEARKAKPVYASDALWGQVDSHGGRSSSMHDRVKFLVWISIQTWHKCTGDMQNPFGELLSRSATITIYQEPKQGFMELQKEANVFDNLSIHNGVIERGYQDGNQEILTIYGQLTELCRFFQDYVYFNGMSEILKSGKHRGASGEFDSLSILAFEMAGCERVTLKNNTCWITVQLRSGSNSMYMHACGGTLPRIRALIRSAVDVWKDPANQAKFKTDPDVSIF